jgi:hypothetical protein
MKRKKRAVAEPVQVYLEASDRERLERLSRELDTTKSDVLRQGLAAMERQVFDPASHPVLRLIGIATTERPGLPPFDVGSDHDEELARGEIASWSAPLSSSPRRRRGR